MAVPYNNAGKSTIFCRSSFLAVNSLIFLFGVVRTEEFQVYRGDVTRGTDRFIVPSALCNKLNKSGITDVCGHFFGTINKNYKPSRKCDCFCPKNASTFIYHGHRWMCLPNDILHCRQDCKYYFKDESPSDPLTIVRDGFKFSLNLTTVQNCELDIIASRYEQCGKVWKPLIKGGTVPGRFELVTDESIYRLSVKSDASAKYLNGQIIKLVVKCAKDPAKSEESCLILKLRGGGLRCSVATAESATPVLPTIGCPTPSSTPVLRPSSVFDHSPTTAQAMVTSPINRVTMSIVQMSSSAVVIIPGGKDERESKPRDSPSLAVIIGPVVAILLLIVIVTLALAFVHHRRKQRNKPGHSLSSTGLIFEKKENSSLNPILDDATYLVPSDIGIMNNHQGVISSASVSNPVYERGNDTSIKLKDTSVEYTIPSKRAPPQRQRNSNSELPALENQGFVSDDNVYSEAWVPGTPRAIIFEDNIEHPASAPVSDAPVSFKDQDHRTSDSLYIDNDAMPRQFYAVLEENDGLKTPEGLDNEVIRDETQTSDSLYDVVGGTIPRSAGEDTYRGPLISHNPIYEDHQVVSQGLSNAKMAENGDRGSSAPLYSVVEENETLGAFDKPTREPDQAPLYDSAETSIYEPVRSEGPEKTSINGRGAFLSVQDPAPDLSQRLSENEDDGGVYQELLHCEGTGPEVSYETLNRPKPKTRTKRVTKNNKKPT